MTVGWCQGHTSLFRIGNLILTGSSCCADPGWAVLGLMLVCLLVGQQQLLCVRWAVES